ncbi:hypothetical protein E2C01_002775 [Portunus trituberculatus]|uniref:Uncharacterized protein n=1 Tax=Portunus trituberculatus TaxID=210409 RepID=A0A5B7CP38_PORTR|nr:hypothetical protein [Portunus trituberculatus]
MVPWCRVGQGQASREWFASALDTLRVLGQRVDPQAYKKSNARSTDRPRSSRGGCNRSAVVLACRLTRPESHVLLVRGGVCPAEVQVSQHR